MPSTQSEITYIATIELMTRGPGWFNELDRWI